MERQEELSRMVRDALDAGLLSFEIERALVETGWPAEQIQSALADAYSSQGSIHAQGLDPPSDTPSASQ